MAPERIQQSSYRFFRLYEKPVLSMSFGCSRFVPVAMTVNVTPLSGGPASKIASPSRSPTLSSTMTAGTTCWISTSNESSLWLSGVLWHGGQRNASGCRVRTAVLYSSAVISVKLHGKKTKDECVYLIFLILQFLMTGVSKDECHYVTELTYYVSHSSFEIRFGDKRIKLPSNGVLWCSFVILVYVRQLSQQNEN